MSTNWIKDTFEKGIDEIQKLARTGSIRIDIANLKKKRDERVKLIGNKVLEKIRTGELKADDFEPDYSYILDIDKKIDAKEADLLEKEPETQKEPDSVIVAQPAPNEPMQSLPTPSPKPVDKEDDERDPHEDYINRPG
ncbi:MAG: hypothetical protein AB7E96_02695 [Deferribacterales bacterium]